MKKSFWYTTAKDYYDIMYTDADMKIFVMAGYITEEEYKEITGKEYIVA